jgi:hypothetical protein
MRMCKIELTQVGVLIAGSSEDDVDLPFSCDLSYVPPGWGASNLRQ